MSRKIKQDNYGNAVLFPIAFVLFAIPMMVYMKLVKLKPIESANWQVVDEHPDFFNYFKSQWLIAAAVLAAIIFFGYTMIKALKIEYKFVYIPIGLYALLIILSTVFSEYRDVALGGFVARYEGMNTLLCYLVLMFTVINLVKSEKQVQFLIKVLMISALIIGLIGLFQLFELDLFRTDFGKRLILPKAYHGTLENVNFRFEKTYIYSTLTNPNYVGSYMVMLIPIAITAFIYFKKTWQKAGMAVLTLLFIANLLGSRSRAGLIGMIVAAFFGIILLRKIIFKRKLVFFGITAAAIAVFVVINASLNGLLTNRILSEIKIMFSSDVQFYDLKDITFSENKVSIVSSTETLNIVKNSEELSFYDTSGNILNINQKNKNDEITITFEEEGYKDYSIILKKNLLTLKQKNTSVDFVILDDGIGLIGNSNKLVNQIEKAPSIGFEGKERLGSARGYIWSRSIPLLKNSILLGYGPDTFTIKFPQEDYIGKIRGYGTARMIVDKPHNMYLQIALNTGILSLLAFLTICGAYIIDSIRLYFKNLDNSFVCLTGTGIFLGICGYLAAAVFNDSMVAIASVFWILLGLGFVCNGFVKKQLIKAR
jgi:O-antigen ligase